MELSNHSGDLYLELILAGGEHCPLVISHTVAEQWLSSGPDQEKYSSPGC